MLLSPPALFLPAGARVFHPVHGIGTVLLPSAAGRHTVIVFCRGEYLVRLSKRSLRVL